MSFRQQKGSSSRIKSTALSRYTKQTVKLNIPKIIFFSIFWNRSKGIWCHTPIPSLATIQMHFEELFRRWTSHFSFFHGQHKILYQVKIIQAGWYNTNKWTSPHHNGRFLLVNVPKKVQQGTYKKTALSKPPTLTRQRTLKVKLLWSKYYIKHAT